jgi:hypothetical protein
MINTNAKGEGGKSKRQIAQEEKRCFWQRHIQGWKESGISQVGYCREQGLKETAFTYWKGKLTQSSSAPSDRSAISLVPIGMKVDIDPSPKPIISKPLVVVVDGRFRIEVSGDFESATLGKLVSTLRQL